VKEGDVGSCAATAGDGTAGCAAEAWPKAAIVVRTAGSAVPTPMMAAAINATRTRSVYNRSSAATADRGIVCFIRE
jgi:hypothetical protein